MRESARIVEIGASLHSVLHSLGPLAGHQTEGSIWKRDAYRMAPEVGFGPTADPEGMCSLNGGCGGRNRS